MAEDFDVEALLEAPYRKEEEQRAPRSPSSHRGAAANDGSNGNGSGSSGGGRSKRSGDENGRGYGEYSSRRRSRTATPGDQQRDDYDRRSRSPRDHHQKQRHHDENDDDVGAMDDDNGQPAQSSGSGHPRSSHKDRQEHSANNASTGGGGWSSRDRDGESRRDIERNDRHRSKERVERSSGSRRGGSKERTERRRSSRSRERRNRRSRSRDKKSSRRSSRSRERQQRSRSRGGGGAAGGAGAAEPRRRSSRSPVSRSGRRGSPTSRRRSRSPRRRHRSPSPRPFRRGRTPPNGLCNRSPPEDLSPEERDARTVFCMQLSQRIRARDLEEFFSSVGKVRDVRLITCNKTKRFKGIAYIEFKDPESVPLALGLSGQRLLGIPISVQHTQAEKNRMANTLPNLQPPKNHVGPMRLYVGSLHFNITEDMLRGIFEPFGKIDSIQLIMDPETNRSKGYGFITFHNADDAKKALEQLNGFELAGRPMKVGNVTERLDVNTNASLDTDEMDRSGIDLGATGRLQLMFKLAEGAGLAVPQAAANALLATAPQPAPSAAAAAAAAAQPMPSIATQCFLLSNMFDPGTEVNPTWDIEITDDVIEECQKHGGILHVYVDKASQGNVYVKCPSIATAVLAVNSLHGRWFAGRVITAAYVPLVNYHALFPDALTTQTLLNTSKNV